MAEQSQMEKMAIEARKAARAVQGMSTARKNAALDAVHAQLLASKDAILAANGEDRSKTKEAVDAGKASSTLYKRLDLGGPKFDAVLQGVRSVAALQDEVGRVSLARELDDGLELYRVACPIGVICIIFEARPEAAVQISALAIKSANAVILKGGKEAEHSNRALVEAIRAGLKEADVPENVVQLVSTRGEIAELLKLEKHIDLVIPRGSNELVRYITDNTRIPVLGHADGICSTYVDSAADVELAAKVVTDAKAQYPAVCNATEKLIVHRDVAATHLPTIGAALLAAGVTIKADEESMRYLPKDEKVIPVVPSDFRTEFLDLTIACRIVESLDAAVDEINTLGSHHTDCIVTQDTQAAERFMSNVDSANVYHNCSTRFADGFRYGFGAEVGVSTTRTHSRGPVGMEGLLIYKYRLYGNGHIAAPYATGEKTFTHRKIEPKYRVEQ
ncbi:putative gamma-glutamyl phosphate reductase [Porphyridium purpureum]|uniref:glutamate-5-semialdehyde dehydrogenase n=1 Tax=Porphyridium purpureum TaxID=35688 RepID=A0A5J4Z501_PORPP|nr:putative gamma-glutamyl phosphate reductase [Porphyridium purpureum]|eukprot:POR1131..scf295_1